MAENTSMTNMTKKRVKPENCEDSLGKQKGTDQNDAEIDSKKLNFKEIVFRFDQILILQFWKIRYIERMIMMMVTIKPV